MTKTEHFNLYTWAPEDFVDLDQVNENFTLLDAALAARQTAAVRALRYAQGAQFNQANMMLHQAHAGADTSYAENVLLDTFKDLSGIASYEKLLCIGGPCVLSSGKSVAITSAFGGSSNFGVTKNGETKTIGYLDAGGFAAVKSISFDYWSGGAALSFSICQNGKLLGQSTPVTYEYVGTNATAKTVSISANLDPNIRAELRCTVSGGSTAANIQLRDVTVAAVETLYTSGTVTTTARNVTGSALRLGVRYSGSAPVLTYKLGSAAFAAPAAPTVKQSKTHTGAPCTMAVYEIPFGGEKTNTPLQLKFALTGVGAQVHDYCAAVL